MKIAVCGCSFNMPVGGAFAGTHWSEILAEELDAELIVFARQGISNNAIRLQINEAIKHDPDWIFINATTPNRIEFATDKNNVVDYELGYDYTLGLANFNYDKNVKTRMVSETMFSVIKWAEHPFRGRPVDADTIEAVKSYAAFIFDFNWKMQVENWVMDSGLWQLHELGKKFIYNQTILNEYRNMHSMPDWFVKKYFVPRSLDLLKLMRDTLAGSDNDPGYHTPPAVQKHIAKQYLDIMKERQSLYYDKEKK